MKAGKWKQRAKISCLYMTALLSVLLSTTVLAAPGDMVIPRSGDDQSAGSMPASIFPHWVHRVRYRCDACHTDIFEMQLGATEISMELMREGKSCAICHDGTRAFKVGFDSCNRCHIATEE
jgi:c(7)-type cytochrome triheme protein